VQTSRQQPVTSTSLVEPWQTHLRINGRAPRTLIELCIAQADYEHLRRLAELKEIAKKLEQLNCTRRLVDVWWGVHRMFSTHRR
jgi:hypothetical protein